MQPLLFFIKIYDWKEAWQNQYKMYQVLVLHNVINILLFNNVLENKF